MEKEISIRKSVMFAAAFAVGLAAGCSGGRDDNTLVMGLDDSFPPMGYRNEANEIVGYDIDLAKEVAKRLNMTLKVQPIDWSAKENELNSHNIDCIWNGFTITPERQKALLFSPPYLKNAQVFVVKDTSEYAARADFAGKKIGTQGGSSGATAIDSEPAFKATLAEVVLYKDYLTAIMDLEAGGVEAVVMDLLVANDTIKRSGKALRVLDDALAPEEYGIGFRKNDVALCDKVWKALEEMAADGTVAKIAEQWFGADISTIGK